MTAIWDRWVAWVSREEDARLLRLVRIFVPLAILSDLAGILRRGVASAVLYPAAFGGISGKTANWYLFDGEPWGGPLAFAVCAIALPFVVAGIAARPAAIVAVVAYAQLGHLFVGGDRGIDRILRTALLILACSAITGGGVGGGRPPGWRRVDKVRAWPMDLLRWLLAIVYLDAGLSKLPTALRWLDPHQPELYTILTDPLAGRLDPVWWSAHPWPFWLGGAATLAVECSAWLTITRWSPYWACCACFIHLGIAATMDLGMFPWGMLALYPVLFAPWYGGGGQRASPVA